ncbi:MAG: response regulator [Chloroflexi bacterium]|jgi:DNA-binding NtrC family response regulator|nr:response regulator [Chloroflexota bacterium]
MGECQRILVVEDEERLRLILRDILRRMGNGYEIIVVSDAEAALTEVEEGGLHLLLTDLRLPEIDGVALTKRLVEAGWEGPIIWMTAYGCHRVRSEAEALNIYCCIDKPLRIDQIRGVVREALAEATTG